MFKNFVKDESGIALGLAVIMIVLIGVMGAGLLVFVRNDLQAVVEVNTGQKAFDIADGGLAAAEQQMLSDVNRQHYDVDHTNDCDTEIRLEEDWSPSTTVYENPDCTGAEITREPGVTKNFAGGKFNVTIQCLEQLNDPTDSTDPCSGVTEDAPESIEASKRTYFKVTSTGYYPADESGAKRKVEAIYYTNDLNVPKAYYTPNDIEFNGNVEIRGVSFFAGGNIIGSNSGSVSIDRGPTTPYKDWDTTNPDNLSPTSNLNTQPRTDGLGNSVEGVGLAAEGVVCDGNDCGTSSADGVYDYDSATADQFVRKAEADLDDPNAAGTITYPYNPYDTYDLDFLKDIAISQGNYYEGGALDIESSVANASDVKYPDPSTSQSVFYIKANGNDIDYDADYSPKAEGLIVIENGNLDISNSSSGFKGAIIVTGDGAATGNYTNNGNVTIEGFVVAEAKLTISGGTDPYVAEGGLGRQPGFYGIQEWSWRECYSETCS